MQLIKGYLLWLSSKNSSFNSASRDDKGGCCRRRRGVIGVTTTDSVGDDESMRSYLSPIEGKGDRQVDRQFLVFLQTKWCFFYHWWW